MFPNNRSRNNEKPKPALDMRSPSEEPETMRGTVASLATGMGVIPGHRGESSLATGTGGRAL